MIFFVLVSFGGGAWSSSCLSFGVFWPPSLDLFSFLSILTVYLLSYSFVALNIYTLMTSNFYILVLASPLNSFYPTTYCMCNKHLKLNLGQTEILISPRYFFHVTHFSNVTIHLLLKLKYWSFLIVFLSQFTLGI